MTKHIVFISLPMSGIPDDMIREDIQKAKNAYLAITKRDIQDVAFVDNMSCQMPVGTVQKEGVWYLGEALKLLSKCDEAFFWLGWRRARGCMIEHEVCTMYNIPTTTVDVTGGEEV